MIKKIIILCCLILFVSGNASWGCRQDPLIYKIKEDLSIEATANAEIIFEGDKRPPEITNIKTQDGEIFLDLKVVQGAKFWNDKTDRWDINDHGTQITLDHYEGINFPLVIFLNIENESGAFTVRILFNQPVFKKC